MVNTQTVLIVGCLMLVGLLFVFGEHRQPTESMPSPAEMRSELVARCVAKPDVIAEIENKIIDNDDALITPAIMRQVLKDVVSHC